MNTDRKSLVLNVTDATFDREVMQAGVPVLVDFWAAWCSPCRVLGPVLESIADAYAGRVRIVKIDVDANSVPFQYAIRSIPTVMLFRDGVVVDHWVGLHSRGEYEEGLQRVL